LEGITENKLRDAMKNIMNKHEDIKMVNKFCEEMMTFLSKSNLDSRNKFIEEKKKLANKKIE
jgi:hypothetical protein